MGDEPLPREPYPPYHGLCGGADAYFGSLRMIAVSENDARLIRLAKPGVKVATLSSDDRRAFSDLEQRQLVSLIGYDEFEQYTSTLDGAIAIGEPPEFWTKMGKRERATFWKKDKRTQDDYLLILTENPDFCAGEYDNCHLLFDMEKRGLIVEREDKCSRFTSMFTSLYFKLTDAGAKAAREINERS